MTLQAITTKYLGPTNTRGGRIKATCEAGTVTVDFRHDLRVEDAHKEAMIALVKKLRWNKYIWQMGALKDVYVFVNTGETDKNCGLDAEHGEMK
jgi:hypothetical protein